VAELRLPFSVREVLHKVFGLPAEFSSMRLFDTLKKWAIEQFAASSFRKHHVGPYSLKKWIPLESLTSFQHTPLKKPLLQSVPRELKETGVQLFDWLLQFTAVKPCPRTADVLSQILDVLKHQNELVDEFYFQLMKQTINNRTLRCTLSTWDLFIIIASLFPPSRHSYPWIIAHAGRTAVDPDQRIANSALFAFMRVQATFLLSRTANWGDAPENIPRDVTHGKVCFGCLLYEMMWAQRHKCPYLPIPFSLYYMIELFVDKDGLRIRRVFTPGAESPELSKVIARANTDIKSIGHCDAQMIGKLIVAWLKALPNPLVPVEMADKLLTDGTSLKFIDTLPQLHRVSLLYLAGFLQQLVSNAMSGLGTQDCAEFFGPLVVNSARANKDGIFRERMDNVGVTLIANVMESQLPAMVYPMKEECFETRKERKRKMSRAPDAGKPRSSLDEKRGRRAKDTDAGKLREQPDGESGRRANDTSARKPRRRPGTDGDSRVHNTNAERPHRCRRSEGDTRANDRDAGKRRRTPGAASVGRARDAGAGKPGTRGAAQLRDEQWRAENEEEEEEEEEESGDQKGNPWDEGYEE
jgi:hypothetical protein